MSRSSTPKTRNIRRRRARRSVGLAVMLALGSNLGCGREFFRQWADQDVSEAIFEKSRDPRWRLDLFSAEPPALSRFADPYDIDRPPAPPDDPAAEALSPVLSGRITGCSAPQEGTGYNQILEAGPRYETPKPEPEDSATQSITPPLPPAGPSPFTPGGIPGPNGPGMTPIQGGANVPNLAPTPSGNSASIPMPKTATTKLASRAGRCPSQVEGNDSRRRNASTGLDRQSGNRRSINSEAVHDKVSEDPECSRPRSFRPRRRSTRQRLLQRCRLACVKAWIRRSTTIRVPRPTLI